MFNFFKKKEKAPFILLASEETLQEALHRSRSAPVVIFKHSILCGVSVMARSRLTPLTADTDPVVYELIVQDARALSDRIAVLFGVRHQSPQAIVLYKAQPVFHTSHGQVTADAIRRAARETLRETVA